MGMMKKMGIGGYAQVDVWSDESEDEGNEPEDTFDIQATPLPEGEPIDIEAAIVVHGVPSEPEPLSTRAHDHLVRLKVSIPTVLANQALILSRLDRIQLTLDEDVTSDTPAAPTDDINA